MHLHAPDPHRWIDLFKNKKTRVGRGLFFPRKAISNACNVSLSTVSPAQQTVDQAKSVLKRDDLSTLDENLLTHKMVNRWQKKTSKKSKTRRKRKVTTEKKSQKGKPKQIRNKLNLNKKKKKKKPKHGRKSQRKSTNVDIFNI